jgi:hypothetical protein
MIYAFVNLTDEIAFHEKNYGFFTLQINADGEVFPGK